MTDSEKNTINAIDSDVQAIHFRPVSFIPHDPEVWFAALESQFETRRITSQRQKYAYALESLPGDHLVAVREAVLNSNVPNVYDRLKEAILRHFLPSREERLRTLLARHPLGDAKPSHHLTRLQSLAGPTASDSEIVKELWLESLPAHIQPTVTALLEDSPLDQVALIADKILARTSNKDTYVVASTARPKVDLDAGHSSAHGDRDGCIHTRLSFRDRCNVPRELAQVLANASPLAQKGHLPSHAERRLRKRVTGGAGSIGPSGLAPAVVEHHAHTRRETPAPASKSGRTRRPFTPGWSPILCARLPHER
ncbi:unnamed protein product [Schistosoma intercalatum]|nr:unnamed protein product [Schistosoma intercalatum]